MSNRLHRSNNANIVVLLASSLFTVMESGWKLSKFQNIIMSVRNIFPGQILSAIICVKKTNFIGKTSCARIQILFFVNGGGGVSGRIMFYCLFKVTILKIVIYLGKYSRSVQTSYMLIYTQSK